MQLDFKLLFSTIKFSWKSLHAIASLRGFFFTLKMYTIKLQLKCYKPLYSFSSLVSSPFIFHPNKLASSSSWKQQTRRVVDARAHRLLPTIAVLGYFCPKLVCM